MSNPPREGIAVIGGGRMALAIGRVLSATGRAIRIHARREEARTELRTQLPEVPIVDDLEHAIEGAGIVFLAVPTSALAETAERYGDFAQGDHIVLTACRGVGPHFTLPHEMIRAKTCVRKIGFFGGPLHIRELATGRAIPAVLASRFLEVIEEVHALIRSTTIRVHESQDIVGVQVAGAISNVTALASGMATALELGETARGVLLTHGLVEARRLGVALGADARTFGGLAGIGDLIPRQVSSTDRHLRVGVQLALGQPVEEAVAAVGISVEGVQTAAEAVRKATALGLELPLVTTVHRVIRQEVDPRAALEAVLKRDLDLQPVKRRVAEAP